MERRTRGLIIGTALTMLLGCGGESKKAAEGLSGPYTFANPEGAMTLTFAPEGKVTMLMKDAAADVAETYDATYTVNGEKVTVVGSHGNLDLVRKGEALEQTIEGVVVRFTKP